MKPNISISKNRGYSNPSDHDGFAVVRVHNGHLAGLGGRNAWVTLVSAQGKKVHRVVKGCGKTPNFPLNGVEFDYETFLELDSPQRPNYLYHQQRVKLEAMQGYAGKISRFVH